MKINLFDLKVDESVENIYIAKSSFIKEHAKLTRIPNNWFVDQNYDKVLIFRDDHVYDNKKEALEKLLETLENKVEQVKRSIKEYPA